MDARPAQPAASSGGGQRLDKWLWFARFARTRTLAAGLVTNGKVRVNKEKVIKPGATVRVGDVITASLGRSVRVVRVLAPGLRRGSATEAAKLFEDLSPPPAIDPATAGDPPLVSALPAPPQREPGSGRPTKRDRRLLDRLKNSG